MFILATNIIVSWQPERWQTVTLTALAKKSVLQKVLMWENQFKRILKTFTAREIDRMVFITLFNQMVSTENVLLLSYCSQYERWKN